MLYQDRVTVAALKKLHLVLNCCQGTSWPDKYNVAVSFPSPHMHPISYTCT